MPLWLTEEQARAIAQHAQEQAPSEACGLIAGDGWQAQQIMPITNRAPDPAHQFYMDEQELFQALQAIDRAKLSLIGLYHSHPQSAPIPSPEDLRHAYYPNTAYLIVSLKQTTPEFKAWQIDNGRVDPVELHIGQSPTPSPTKRLTKTQVAAILISAALALVILLTVSLSLLPPAPDLPTPVR